MQRKRKIKKVHVLGLGRGYVETASWATVLLVHRRGFKCVQDALENLNLLTLEYCRQLSKEQEESRERERKRTHDRGLRFDDYEILKPECLIEDVWEEIIKGDLQDHGDMWELLAGQGWDACAAWVGPMAAKSGICWLETSPQLISQAPSWGDRKVIRWGEQPDEENAAPNSLYYAESHIHHIPKGVKKFRSEVK